MEFNPKLVKGFRLVGYDNWVLRQGKLEKEKIAVNEVGSGHSVTYFLELYLQKSKPQTAQNKLKYQSPSFSNVALENNELATLNIDYNAPNNQSRKSINKVIVEEKPSKPSEDFTFACSVVEFGLLLRNSKYKANAEVARIKKWASQGRGKDKKGDRKQFLELVKKYEKLSGEE